jgi:hypothetical protein
MIPHKFDAAITEYREVHRRCQVLSGDALSAAQDEEGGSRRSGPNAQRMSRRHRRSCTRGVGSMGVTSSCSTAFGGT